MNTRKLIGHRILLLAALIALALPATLQAQFTFITNNNAITITGYGGPGGNVVIPDSINGYPVTVIGFGVFFESFNITSVTLPDSITSIEEAAFMGSIGLTSITIPGNVTNIGVDAFSSCLALTNVAIPASVASIGDYAFFYCNNLTAIDVDAANPNYSSVDGVLFNKDQTTLMQFPFGKSGSYSIPSTVTNLADEAFGINDYGDIGTFYSIYSCSGLTNLNIPGSLVNIGTYAFSRCTGLQSVTIAYGISTIESNAFSWCPNLTGVSIPNSVTSIGDLAFYYSGLASVNMQEGLISIGEGGFNFCTNLTSVTFPDGLTSIGERAFLFCSGLTNAIIPASVTNIGPHAFASCASLENISVNGNNPCYSSIDGILFNKDQTVLIQFPGGRGGSYAIPSGVTSIGDHAFGTYDLTVFYPLSCIDMTNIIVPATVTNIGDGALFYLLNLTSIYFEGDAPTYAGSVGNGFSDTTYYMPGTSGWGQYFADSPTALWLPQMQSDASFGFRTNQFGFNINWAGDRTVIVESCTDLGNPIWTPVSTNTLTGGTSYFSDPQWTNYPSRYYRIRSP